MRVRSDLAVAKIHNLMIFGQHVVDLLLQIGLVVVPNYKTRFCVVEISSLEGGRKLRINLFADGLLSTCDLAAVFDEQP